MSTRNSSVRRPRMFGRLAYVEAEVTSLAGALNRHLDECTEIHRNDRQWQTDVLDRMDNNARACIASAEGVRKDLSEKLWRMLWQTLVGVLGITLLLAAALLKFHPAL